MSLNWDAKKCDQTVLDEKNWPITEILIFATMAIDMGEFTEANIEKVLDRLAAYQKLNGGLVVENVDGKWVTRNVTEDEVRLRIGLKTNVTTVSDAKFRNRMARELMRR